MRLCELEHARVAILGMGREGHAVWRRIRRRYPRKPLSLFSESAIDGQVLQQLDAAVDAYHPGPLDTSSLRHFDVLVRSAGISIYRHELSELRTLGVQFTTASSIWFAENPNAKTICISGTLGKSTTSTLIAHLLNQAGVRACLAGNIGRPMLDFEGQLADWWVIELSSYQISDLDAKPDIAVLLNLYEEHLDWHRGFENYKADKLRLAKLASGGRIIANFSDRVLGENLRDSPGINWFNRAGGWQAAKSSVFRRSGESGSRAVDQTRISAPASLPGEHNMQNLAAALSVVDVLGLKIPRIDAALSSFKGLTHRLQLIGEAGGVRYVNDSISTTPVAVTAALQTLGYQDVVLLLGGMDRGLDWRGFARSMRSHPPFVIITLPDNGPRIYECLKMADVEPEGGLYAVSDLAEAVSLAKKLVPETGCILLSPGAPSFPHFRDYQDRGEQFKKLCGF
jgi:UDP-N-acetylmuramoylalanine--D-glutamate ligase